MCRIFGALIFVQIAALILGPAPTVNAQVPDNKLPPLRYYMLYSNYYDGDYKQVFSDARTTPGTFRMGTERFLDSACYWVLAGECQYHMGNYKAALEFYEDSLRLFASFQANGWQSRLTPPNILNVLPNALQRAAITWGQPKRAFDVPALPDSITMMFGEMFSGEMARLQGGVVDEARLRPVDAGEIMRCIGIALHRRSSIKGRICEFDRLTGEIVSQLESSPRNDGSLFGAWNGVLAGIAYSGAGEYDQAKRSLEGGLQFGGRFDHQLTPLGLLHLALVNYRQGDLTTAAYYALEASYSAAIFQHFDIVEEALALGTTIHLESKQPGVYPPLADAIVWTNANRNRATAAATSLRIRLAECFSESGDAASSARFLAEATRSFSTRTGLGTGSLNGRANYLAAVNLFIEGNFDSGMAQLQKAINEYSTCSRWLFRLNWVEEAFLRRELLPRHTNTLYGLLLRDPGEREWRSDPIEAMTFLMTPHLTSIDRWLQIAIADRNYQQAIQVAELYRRHWFYSTLPLGGREIAFRWTMHGPLEALTNVAEKQRRDFFTRFPVYREVSDQAEKLRLTLLTKPLHHAPQSDEERDYVKIFAEYSKVTQRQDSLLASIALRREPAEMAYPPQIDFDEMKLRLDETKTVLYCIETNHQIYFFEITSLGVRLLSSHSSKDVTNLINKFFRDTSLRERELSPEMITNPAWKKSSFELAQKLIPNLTLRGDAQNPHELVIVPTGATWYLPFEALCLSHADDKTEFLMDRARVRYSPTMGLAIIPQRPVPQWDRSAFFVDKVSDSLDQNQIANELQALVAPGPSLAVYSDRMPVPSSLFGAICDEFVVWIGMGKMPNEGPYGLELVQKDRGLKGNRLSNWLTLPWEGPGHVVLPFYESGGSKGIAGNNPGDDLFLLTTALLASGTKTALVSRWPTNGISGLKFSSTYRQETRKHPPIEAIHLARMQMIAEPLDFDREPRAKKAKGQEQDVVNAEHPFFWAGYMLVDVPGTKDPNQGIENLQNELVPADQLEARPADLPAVDNPPPKLQGIAPAEGMIPLSSAEDAKGKKQKAPPKKSKDKDKSKDDSRCP
ncbi:MAG: CHAT domain-containing protein [Pirellulaceae bacterium]|nr:CHAT domain-containing protein [Pirellulaceae bacterium]